MYILIAKVEAKKRKVEVQSQHKSAALVLEHNTLQCGWADDKPRPTLSLLLSSLKDSSFLHALSSKARRHGNNSLRRRHTGDSLGREHRRAHFAVTRDSRTRQRHRLYDHWTGCSDRRLSARNEDRDGNVGSLGCRRGGNGDGDGAASREGDVCALIGHSLEHGGPVAVRALGWRSLEDAGSAAVVVCAD
jgi:hypothetical protein